MDYLVQQKLKLNKHVRLLKTEEFDRNKSNHLSALS